MAKSGTVTLELALADVPMVVAYRGGVPVRLEEVARVYDSVENDKSAAWYYSQRQGSSRGIILSIQKQPGTNIVEATVRLGYAVFTSATLLGPDRMTSSHRPSGNWAGALFTTPATELISLMISLAIA